MGNDKLLGLYLHVNLLPVKKVVLGEVSVHLKIGFRVVGLPYHSGLLIL